MNIGCNYIIQFDDDLINILNTKTSKKVAIHSLMAIRKKYMMYYDKKDILAYGDEALAYVEDDSTIVINPLANNEKLSLNFIKYLSKEVIKAKIFFKGAIFLVVPYEADKSNKILLKKLFIEAGFRKCHLIVSQMAMTIGANIDITNDIHNIIVIIEKDIVRISIIQKEVISLVENLKIKNAYLKDKLVQKLKKILMSNYITNFNGCISIINKTKYTLDINYVKTVLDMEVVNVVVDDNTILKGAEKIVSTYR